MPDETFARVASIQSWLIAEPLSYGMRQRDIRHIFKCLWVLPRGGLRCGQGNAKIRASLTLKI